MSLNTESPTTLLQSLIRIPSVNPEGASKEALATGQYGEKSLAETIAPMLSDHGFSVVLEEVQPNRPNLIAKAPGSKDRPRILLGPHLDTVGVETMTIEPFGAEISDSKIWGRGASDTKGSMAAMLWGLIQNKDLLSDAPVAIDFVGFMGEETQQLGAKHFAQHHGNNYSFAIAGEPTSLDIVHCTKGSLWATLSAKGVAAHASQPERGENAIIKLFSAFQEIMEKLDSIFSETNHPILGHSTWNLGTIQGGTRPNVVADQAKLTVDIRTIPSLWNQGGAAKLLKYLCDTRELEMNYHEENPPMDVSPDNKWIQAIQKAHPNTNCVGAPWFSDAAHLNAGGVPAICLGPGNIAQAHTKDEFISLKDLNSGANYFSELIQSLCN